MSLIPDQFRGLRNPSLSGAIIAFGALVALLYFGRNLLITLITAVILAFMLEPLVHLLVRLRLPRSLASAVVCGIAGLVLYLMALGFYSQVASLVEELPNYRQRIAEVSDRVAAKLEAAENAAYDLLMPKRMAEQARAEQAAREAKSPKRKKQPKVAAAPVPPPMPVPGSADANAVPEVRIRPERPPLVDYVYSQLASIYEVLLMISFVPFLVYFMLSWRDHVYRSFLLLFREESGLVASRTLEGIAGMVRAFVVGNFVLGMLLTVLSTAAFSWMALPYPLLVGSLSGFVSLVPYFGLPLAMVPPMLATVAQSTKFAPYLLVAAIVAGLHLVALNLLYPKIVGQRVHLNPLVVTVALMFWGAIWGAPGFLLAIPLTAAVKAVCDNVPSLEPYGRFLGDSRPPRQPKSKSGRSQAAASAAD